jgi:transposase
MEPDPDALHRKVMEEFKNYKVETVYECGCFGYSAHRKFVSYGWNSIVVNPCDIPRISKQKFTKTDTIDAINLSKLLKAGMLCSITIPDVKREQLRSLFRRRVHTVMYTRSIKVRLKAQLLYFGIEIPKDMDNAAWTKNFRQWVKEIKWEHETGKLMMLSNINQVEYLHYETNEISNHLRKYCRDNYKKTYNLLRSIPGIGPLTAICFISEVGDINRFKNFKQLACLVGMMPTTYQSSDTNRTQGLTPRALRIMRSYLVEASW